MRELLLELCLTLPARLSTLLPYLHLLMQPVLHALRSCAELVTLALRTLEFWIDHLHPEFVQPLMAPLMRELMIALCKQLRPSPYPFGPTALRILGKLGGRNRSSSTSGRRGRRRRPSATTAAASPSAGARPGASGASPPSAGALDGAVGERSLPSSADADREVAQGLAQRTYACCACRVRRAVAGGAEAEADGGRRRAARPPSSEVLVAAAEGAPLKSAELGRTARC